MIADIKHAIRTLVRMPILATVVIVSLGVGIGMNTVVFSWIQARLLRPIPGVARSATIQLIETKTDTGMYPGLSWLEYRDLRERLTSFRDVLAFRTVPVYVGESGQVERRYGLLVSDNYFGALGLRPAHGRFFSRGEMETSPREPVVVISFGLWQSRFDGSNDAVGRTLRMNNRTLTIVGVTPERFQGTVMGLNFDVWLPATLAPIAIGGSRELEDRRVRGYSALGILREGATPLQAQAQLDAAMAELARTYPETNATVRAEVLPMWRSPRGPLRLLTPALMLLQAMMLLLLVAVCGNTTNLALARASARQREIAVRLAIGAGPRRITTLLLTENLMLGLAGAGLGIPIAMWGSQAFQLLPLSGLPLRFQTEINVMGLGFAMLLGVGCGVACGAAPAMQLARVEPLTVFRSGSRAATRSRFRNALMGIQVGLAVISLILAGVFLRNFLQTREIDPGFNRTGVLLTAYDLTGRNLKPPALREFTDRLLAEVRALPGVASASIASSVPLDIHGLPPRPFTVDGHTRNEPGLDRALVNTVTPGYFETMQIPVLAGSDFAPLADGASPPQVVVNHEFVRRYLSGREPIGRNVQLRGERYIIAGVVRNSLYNAFGEPATPAIYLSYRDAPASAGELHVRTQSGQERSVADDVRRALWQLDPNVPVFNVRTLTEHIETNLVFRRVPARMFMILGPLLITLAAIGIYAVVAYTISLRTAEIGVRLAVGATSRRVVAEIVADSLLVIALGALVGTAIALVVALDVGRRSIDAPVFVGVPLLLLLVGAVASWLPARGVTQLDPVAALRQD